MKNRLAFNKKYFVILVLLSYIPFLLLNQKHSHDWGDDFAHYLIQADKIAGDHSYDNLILYNNGFAPPSKGLVFSFFIFVLQSIGLGSITQLTLFNSIWMVAASLIFFLWMRGELGNWMAWLISIFFLYSYHILLLKMELLSEFMYIFSSLFFVYLMDKKFKGRYFYLGLIAAICFNIRHIGLSIFASGAIYILVENVKNKEKFSKLLNNWIFYTIPSLIMIVVTYNSIIWYFNHGTNGGIDNYSLQNMSLYFDNLRALFIFNNAYWGRVFFPMTLIIFSIIGYVFSAKKDLKVHHIYVFLYLFILSKFNYTGTALRYLLPIFPFFLYYAFWTIQTFSNQFLKMPTNVFGLALLIVMIVPERNFVRDLWNNRTTEIAGPYSSEAKEAWGAVKKFTTSEDVLLFDKPFVTQYFTRRHTVVYNLDTIIPNRKKYYLIATQPNQGEVYDEGVYSRLKCDSTHNQKIWQNNSFALFYLF